MKLKLFLSSILLFFVVNHCFSQTYKGSEADNLIRNTDLVRIKSYTQVPNYFRFSEDATRSEHEAIEIVKNFITNSNSNLQLKKVQPQGDGTQTLRYYQTVYGLPIEFTALNLQVKNNQVTEVNGEILDNPEVNPNFLISEAEALQRALDFVDAEQYMWEDNSVYFPTGEKVIVPNKVGLEASVLKSAYKFEIYSKNPFNRQMIYVDAENGGIVLDLPLIHFSNGNEKSIPGTAETAYYGEQQIDMNYNGSQYILHDDSRGSGIRTYNCHNTANYNAATDFYNNNTYWDNAPYATDAHFSTISAYDYFLQKHGYNSINNAGFPLRSYVHFNLIQYGYPNNVNAFWNGEWMTYGDGDPSQGITPLTTIDICGHEITHGLVQFTAGLVYQYESGALNEAFADIFGTAIEHFAVPEYANWLMGDAMGRIIRNTANPKALGHPNNYKGVFWDFQTQQVHRNSNPFSHWFYLISEGGSGTNDFGNTYNVTSIGMSKAEQIAFKLLTQYLTPTSGYVDACFLALQVATNLFGINSNEVKSVGNAFYAIGVLDEPYIQDFPSFYADVVRSCDGIINFKDHTGTEIDSWLWDFGDGRTSTLQHPTHQYYENGEYTVTLTITDTEGQHSLTKENYIVIANMNELASQEFEVAPDESFELYIPNASSNLKWYANINDSLWAETPVFTGNPIQHPAISEDKTYYILDRYENDVSYIGETSCSVTGGFFNADVVHYLIFDVYQKFNLKSVLVNAQSAGNRQIMLRNNFQSIIWTKNVHIPAGISRITIDEEIPVGTHLQLACNAYPGLFRSDVSANLQYPYTIENVASILMSSASSDIFRYYYYFYDWEIELPDCHSELAMVTIIMEEEEEIGIQDDVFQNVTIAPNPSNGLFRIENLKNVENYTVTVSEISGRTLNTANLLNGNTLDLSSFANGIYLVRIGDRVFKVVKN